VTTILDLRVTKIDSIGLWRELRDEFRTFFLTECPDLAPFEDIQKLVAQELNPT
jgi:hypothetical protein